MSGFVLGIRDMIKRKNGNSVCVLEAKGIVGVAHVTQVIVLKKLHCNNYNKREIHVSYKRYMVL